MDTWKHSKDTCKSSDAKNTLKRTFWSCLHRQASCQQEEQLGQINSNLNPISGRPISIGGIITRREASYSTTGVQLVPSYMYNQLGLSTPFAQELCVEVCKGPRQTVAQELLLNDGRGQIGGEM